MDQWTAVDRSEFIQDAIFSQDTKGNRGHYWFNVSQKSHTIDNEKKYKNNVTESLAKTIFESKPEFRKISMTFYNDLIYKITQNQFLAHHFGSNIIVMIKGSNAYAYITSSDDFKFSDLDIVIYINPYLPEDLFNNIRNSVKTILLQTMSQFKRMLDHMFFIENKSIEYPLLTKELVQEFKKEYKNAISKINLEDEEKILSPFESNEVRNYCSKNSCILTNSIAQDDSMVRIDVPHYESCERIPLKKTPFFCSYNETINFDRDVNKELKGDFDLYRIRMNNMFVNKEVEERLPSDFIDVSIANIDDYELKYFWNYGRCLSIYDKYINSWITVPDIKNCIDDLYKMLNIYDCPEGKREKRQIKYEKLIEFAKNM